MTARLLAVVLIAGFALSGSLVVGLLVNRRTVPRSARDFTADFDRHWSQTADLFTPEEGRDV